MKKLLTLYTIALLGFTSASAQLKIGTPAGPPDASAMLQIESSNRGLRLPQVALTTTTTFGLTAPTSAPAAVGMTVYNTTAGITSSNPLYPAAGIGAYTWDGTGWAAASAIAAIAAQDLRLVGTRNHITIDAGVGANGTSVGAGGDNIALGASSMVSNTTGTRNVAMNTFALQSNTTGSQNIAIGQEALNLNTTASDNIALGYQTLKNNSTAGSNVAIGSAAMTSNTTGSNNTAVGQNAMGTNLVGVQNSAFGFLSLFNNKGGFNTGLGVAAGSSITTGNNNTAVGYSALSSTTFTSITGNNNVGVGVQALSNMTTGSNNVAVGGQSGFSLSTGSSNTAVGINSGTNLTGGSSNILLGSFSGAGITSGSNNIAVGFNNMSGTAVTGTDNVSIGNNVMGSLTTGTRNVNIGSTAANVTTGNQNTTIGYGANVPNGAGNNQLSISNSIYGLGMGTGTPTIGINIATPNTAYVLDVNGKTHTNDGIVINSAGQPQMSITTTTAAIVSVPANAIGNVYYEITGAENHVFGGNVVCDNTGYTLGLPTVPWANVYATNVNVGGTILYGALNGGHIVPAANNTYDLGNATFRWRTIYSNNVLNVSDARLKTNITDAGYGLSSVMKMRPVTYNWKTDPNTNHMVGFLAQDIEKIVPEAVYVPKTKDENYAINYIALIPVLTKAIQEQQAEINALKARLEKLENR